MAFTSDCLVNYQMEQAPLHLQTWVSALLNKLDLLEVLSDRDGTIDMIFPTCKSIDSGLGIGRSCYLNIVYNKQCPLCKSSSDFQKKSDCRLPGNLCTKDPDFHFDFSEDNNDVSILDL